MKRSPIDRLGSGDLVIAEPPVNQNLEEAFHRLPIKIGSGKTPSGPPRRASKVQTNQLRDAEDSAAGELRKPFERRTATFLNPGAQPAAM